MYFWRYYISSCEIFEALEALELSAGLNDWLILLQSSALS